VNYQINLWPLTLNTTDQITAWVHRQIQDVGTLTEEIEIPNRWIDPIEWQLARRLAFECEDVDPARIQMVQAESDKYLIDSSAGENDHTPTRILPQIRGYTRDG
jgi:hypothetical protein